MTTRNLVAVSLMPLLYCQDNPLTELDIRHLKHLKDLNADAHVRIIGTRP